MKIQTKHLTKLLSVIIAICFFFNGIPFGDVTGIPHSGRIVVNAATSPLNVSTNLVQNNLPVISLNGNEASRTMTTCQVFTHNGPIKIKNTDPDVADITYTVAGKHPWGQVVFITLKFKKIDTCFFTFNKVNEDTFMDLFPTPSKYDALIKSLTIGKKKYDTKNSFSFSGKALKNQKIDVKASKGMKVKYLYTVDNYEWVNKGKNKYTMSKKYKNGAKVNVPDGYALHAVLSSTFNNIDLCIYTAGGKSDGSESESSGSSKSSGSKKAPGKVSITKLTPGKWGSGSCMIEWKQIDGVDGYELDTSENKNFKGNVYRQDLEKKYSGGGVDSMPVGKTMYFRVRAYRIVNGKKKYGKWSAVKSAKIK